MIFSFTHNPSVPVNVTQWTYVCKTLLVFHFQSCRVSRELRDRAETKQSLKSDVQLNVLFNCALKKLIPVLMSWNINSLSVRPSTRWTATAFNLTLFNSSHETTFSFLSQSIWIMSLECHVQSLNLEFQLLLISSSPKSPHSRRHCTTGLTS